MVSFPTFKKKGEKLFLALDIGTEAIKSLIFKKEEERNVILGADLKEYYRIGIRDGIDFEKGTMKKAILEVVNQAGKQDKIETKDYITFWRLPGNILKERIILIFFRRKNPKKIINQEEDNEIYRQILNQAQQKISQEISQETGILPRDLHFIDFKILERKIDGYQVNQLTGASGQDLVTRTLLTFLPKNYLENIEKIAKDLKLNGLRLISEAENLFLAFSDQKITGIFLDIGGRFTQIFLMRDGQLRALNGLEMGGENFSQKLSQSLGIDKVQAEDLKIRYTQRALSEEVRKRIKEIFLSGCQSWLYDLKLRLKEISQREEKILPPTIFIFGGGSLLPEVEETLNEEKWEDLPFLSQPEIKFILLKDFKNIEDKGKIKTTSQYIPSLLLCYTP